MKGLPTGLILHVFRFHGKILIASLILWKGLGMKPSVYKGKFDVASARRSFAQKFGRQYGLPSADIMVEYDNGGNLCKNCTGSIRGRGPVV